MILVLVGVPTSSFVEGGRRHSTVRENDHRQQEGARSQVMIQASVGRLGRLSQ